MTDKELQEIKNMHEDYIKYEGAIYGGTGSAITNCYSYQDKHNEFCEWLIDGFESFMTDFETLKSENKQLQAQLAAKETTLNGTYIDINTHFRDIKKLQSENTRLKDTNKALESSLYNSEMNLEHILADFERTKDECRQIDKNAASVQREYKSEIERLKAERDKAVEDLAGQQYNDTENISVLGIFEKN